MLWDYSLPEMLLMGFFLLGFCIILSWIVDSIIDAVGYGLFGNAILIFSGVILGTYSLNMYGYEIDRFPMFSLVTVTAICFGMFLTMLILRKAIR